jgi:hypothetical protein
VNNRRTRSNWIVDVSERTSGAVFHRLHFVRSGPKWDLVKLCAAVGLAGGPIAATVGLLLLALNLGLKSVGRSVSVLETVGSVLLISIIPLLMLGAHCLDKLDERIANNLRPPSNGNATASALHSQLASSARK